jgi:hypothetical protein
LTSSLQNDLLTEQRPRLRICGTVEGIPTLQVADVLDLTQRGALIVHEDMFPPQSVCLLQLGTNGDLSTIRCRVLHSRVSSVRPGGGPYYETMVEFLNVSPAAERALRNVVQSFGTKGGVEAGGP